MSGCAITGHRPNRFKWKYKENNTGCKRLKKRLHDLFILLYDRGVRRFYVGGALGVDMWAGEILLRLKEQPEYSDIELVVVLPFEGHDIDWDDRSRCRMRFLIQHSAGTVVTGTADEPKNAYKSHYYYMIDHADCLLAVYDNNRSVHSETSMIVHYAQQKAIPVIFVHPDTAEVSREGYHYKQCGTYGLHERYTDKT